MTWRALDLFSGIGGWSLGLHMQGCETVAACEINPWKRQQYRRHFPAVKLYTDVCALTSEALASDGIEAIDIVVGSPPCTDISTANTRGLGVDGPESGLYFEAIRIIGEVRPRWCALENSANLRARGSDRVLAALEAAGYAMWPLVVGAVHAGAPHRRLRSWLVGVRREIVARADADQLAHGAAGWRFGSAESTGETAGEHPHAHGTGLRLEPGRSRGAERAQAAVAVWSDPPADPHANSQGQHVEPEHEEMGGRSGDAGSRVGHHIGGGG